MITFSDWSLIMPDRPDPTIQSASHSPIDQTTNFRGGADDTTGPPQKQGGGLDGSAALSSPPSESQGETQAAPNDTASSEKEGPGLDASTVVPNASPATKPAV